MRNPRLRKCARCGNNFDIFDNDFIKEKNRFYEVNCYKERQLFKGVEVEAIEEAIEIFLKQTRLEREEKETELLAKAENSLSSKKKEINRAEFKELFIEYLKETYGLLELPKTLYTKIAQINSGNFKDFKIAIPYEDLLDMFKRKQSYLNKVYMNNVSKGKEMTPVQRISYDISVIVNKYEDYLKWKNKQKMLENDYSKVDEVKVDYTKFKNTTKNVKNETDILSILDDLY